ncbi:DUF4124 domain-containing protein [Luteimonas sp. A478]
MRLAIVCAVLFLAAATAGASDIYQWTDVRGVTHYSESPPPAGTQYQVRRITDSGAGLRTEQPASAAPEVNPQCTAAQANIEVLQSEGPVFQEDDSGERVALSDDDRSRQLELAQAAVRAYCSSAS